METQLDIETMHGDFARIEREWEELSLLQKRQQVATWGKSFSRMEKEWELASGTTSYTSESLVAADPDSLVANWRSKMSRMEVEESEHRRTRKWVSGPADVLQIINRQKIENFHSDIIAWLLDPGAPHGFGIAFLKAFLLRCFGQQVASDDSLWGARVEREIPETSSREDIVIWMSDCTVVIETKIEHEEGDHQIQRIYNDFCEKKPAPRFLFLTTDGRAPESRSIEACAAFAAASFGIVGEVLDAVIRKKVGQVSSEIPPGLASAVSYLQTLKEVFP